MWVCRRPAGCAGSDWDLARTGTAPSGRPGRAQAQDLGKHVGDVVGTEGRCSEHVADDHVVGVAHAVGDPVVDQQPAGQAQVVTERSAAEDRPWQPAGADGHDAQLHERLRHHADDHRPGPSPKDGQRHLDGHVHGQAGDVGDLDGSELEAALEDRVGHDQGGARAAAEPKHHEVGGGPGDPDQVGEDRSPDGDHRRKRRPHGGDDPEDGREVDVVDLRAAHDRRPPAEGEDQLHQCHDGDGSGDEAEVGRGEQRARIMVAHDAQPCG